MEAEGTGHFPLTPTQGTYVIGVCSAVPACLATLTIQIFGRRTILITGYFFMALSLLVCGYSVYEGQDLVAFITLCFYISTFDISQGSIAWLYVPEVTVDAAAGFATGA